MTRNDLYIVSMAIGKLAFIISPEKWWLNPKEGENMASIPQLSNKISLVKSLKRLKVINKIYMDIPEGRFVNFVEVKDIFKYNTLDELVADLRGGKK